MAVGRGGGAHRASRANRADSTGGTVGAGEPGRRGVARRGAVVAVQVIASVVSVTLLLGFGYGWYEYRALDSGLQRLSLSNLSPVRSGAVSGPQGEGSASAVPKVHGSEQNILVVGVDSRAGLSEQERQLLSVGSDVSYSADTIMIIHVPADGSRATMISIPRDSFVDIPGGYLKNKINAAYADGYVYAADGSSDEQRQAAGANVLIGAISQLTGLEINHYIQVGFGGFYTIAKAIGKIPVDLCEATDDTLAYNEAQGLGRVGSNFKMSAGWHDLTPVQALEFVRQRHNLVGGDVAREKRQRYFLTQAFKQIASAGYLLNPVKMDKLIKAVSNAFYRDDNLSILDLVSQMASLSANNITGYTIPTEGEGTVTVAGQSQSVLFVDPERVQQWITTVLSTAAATPSPSSPPSTSAPTATQAPGSSGAPAPSSGCIH